MRTKQRLRQWDYLIVTASNDTQARGYERQLATRRELGLLGSVDQTLVVADPGGRRVGSGGSTLYCLLNVLNQRLGEKAASSRPDVWQEILSELRILIIHAGGDSRRLPAYGPCGKIFVPAPGDSDSAVCLSLFDKQLPVYLGMGQSSQGQGQIVITSGDVLLRFDPESVRFAGEGITGLSCFTGPEQASRHGVFCAGSDSRVRVYLQKPSPAEQEQRGALDAYGQACLDIGVMNFDAETAVRLMEVFGAASADGKTLDLVGEMGDAVNKWGLDFYRELCCAMGTEASSTEHVRAAKASGSQWTDNLLGRVFAGVSSIPFSVQLLHRCEFLDFGACRGLIDSGTRLVQEERGISHLRRYLDVNNTIGESGSVQGWGSWVEGCRINSTLSLGGENMVVGVDVEAPLELKRGACLDVIGGADENGKPVRFVRCYGLDDRFKETVEAGASFCGIEVMQWLDAVGAKAEDVWDKDVPAGQRSMWNARMFPAVKKADGYLDWLWMCDPGKASDKQKETWLKQKRYSHQQILGMADADGFHRRRESIRAASVREGLTRMFRPASDFSAAELVSLLSETEDLTGWIVEILQEAWRHYDSGGMSSLVFGRIIHTLGSAVGCLCESEGSGIREALISAGAKLNPAERDGFAGMGLGLDESVDCEKWSETARAAAFTGLQRAIAGSGQERPACPKSVLRSDEIVWARAAARLDVGGGWTDTPPYALEWGGTVINTAVNLNGQPPIQAYLRVIDEPVIRIASIDVGVRAEILKFEELMDYRQATSSFALAKAALALSGLTPQALGAEQSLADVLGAFGGGIELTTLAAIPKGSGLGTSSIMGAVIMGAISRAMGRKLSQRELFHSVLKLEQALTTGGGWQDQIGGATDGVKIISTEPGLVPDARIHYVPSDVLDPEANGGVSLLYYTGVTRLAKNILAQVVGRYLDRDRAAMETLRQMKVVARHVAAACERRDVQRFGELVDVVWELNKQLDPNSTNDAVEELLARIRPHVWGAKLLGAGGGGFLLMIAKSPNDAAAIREVLDGNPVNDRARFFDYDISREGLTVTVS